MTIFKMPMLINATTCLFLFVRAVVAVSSVIAYHKPASIFMILLAIAELSLDLYFFPIQAGLAAIPAYTATRFFASRGLTYPIIFMTIGRMSMYWPMFFMLLSMYQRHIVCPVHGKPKEQNSLAETPSGTTEQSQQHVKED